MSSIDQSLGNLYDHSDVNNYYNPPLRIIQVGNTQSGILSTVVNNYYQGHVNSNTLAPNTPGDFQNQITELYDNINDTIGANITHTFSTLEGEGFAFNYPLGTAYSDAIAIQFPDFGNAEVSLSIANTVGNNDIGVEVTNMSIITLDHAVPEFPNLPLTISLLNITTNFSSVYTNLSTDVQAGLGEATLKIEDNYISDGEGIGNEPFPQTPAPDINTTWKHILYGIKSYLTKELGSILSIYVGSNIRTGTQYLRLQPVKSEIKELLSSGETKEYTINIFLYHQPKKNNKLEGMLNIISTLESAVRRRTILTLGDGTRLFNCRIATTELENNIEDNYNIVSFIFKADYTHIYN